MIGRILGNRYEIIEKIGGGGMALVYKAKCQLLNRYVAVKVLRPGFTSDEEFISKFKRESQSAASLSHPNIVNIYDVGNDHNDVYYIVMEYVKGKTLKQIIKERGPLKSEETINIGKQICLALQHAHSNHIVHRDIKPHNILITDDGRVKVTDFGIARAVTSSTVTNTGSVIGSVHYFSPEQARGGYVDEKSDLYSLGIVLYEMITGRVPFEGESPISVALKHINEEVTPPSSLNMDISKALEDIIAKAMRKDQMKRYNNANEVLEDLNQALRQPSGNFVKFEEDDDSPTQVIPIIKDNESIGAKSITDSSKGGKNGKKDTSNRMVFWGAIATAFILAMLFIGGGVFYFNNYFGVEAKDVPNTVGLPYEEAKQNLENLGFKVEVSSEQSSSEYEQGIVMSQNPEAGKTVKPGFTIKLIVSKGPKPTQVPNLVNKNIDEVEFTLSNAKLKQGSVIYEFSSLPIGIVISQSPSPNTDVAEGTAVNVVVSQGPETKVILMPSVIGHDIGTARRTIETSGLIVGDITYRHDPHIAKDLVIEQSTAPGVEVEENKVIHLVVSKGPENIGQIPVENQLPNKAVNLNISFDLAKREEFVLRIVKIQDNVTTDIYNEVHQKSKGKENIRIEGRGKARIEIFFDEVLVAPVNVDFETGTAYD